MLTVFFWIAVALGAAAALAAFSDEWLGRSDPAGRGMAAAFGWLLLPFPCLALLLFLLGRSHGFRVAGLVVAAAPAALAIVLALATRVTERAEVEAATARSIFGRGPGRPLADAIEAGSLEKLRGLAAQGVDVNAAGRKGETPLWFALRKGRPDAAAVLAALGADPRRGPEGERPALVVAAREPKDVDALRAMLKAGTSPDTVLPDDIGQPTALVFHAMNTEAHANVRAVVEAGARLDVRDPNGDTPLGRALVHRSWDDALSMIEHGAPPDGRQATSRTLEEIVAELVPPAAGTPEAAAFARVLEALRAKGVPVRSDGRVP